MDESTASDMVLIYDQHLDEFVFVSESAPPADAESAPPADAESAQPADAESAQPADAESAMPAEAESAPPADAESAMPAEAESAQPADAESAMPAEAESAQPADAESAMPAEAESAQPADAESAMPAEAESAQPSSAGSPTQGRRGPLVASLEPALLGWVMLGGTDAAGARVHQDAWVCVVHVPSDTSRWTRTCERLPFACETAQAMWFSRRTLFVLHSDLTMFASEDLGRSWSRRRVEFPEHVHTYVDMGYCSGKDALYLVGGCVDGVRSTAVFESLGDEMGAVFRPFAAQLPVPLLRPHCLPHPLYVAQDGIGAWYFDEDALAFVPTTRVPPGTKHIVRVNSMMIASDGAWLFANIRSKWHSFCSWKCPLDDVFIATAGRLISSSHAQKVLRASLVVEDAREEVVDSIDVSVDQALVESMNDIAVSPRTHSAFTQVSTIRESCAERALRSPTLTATIAAPLPRLPAPPMRQCRERESEAISASSHDQLSH